jgi:hypothetical protein
LLIQLLIVALSLPTIPLLRFLLAPPLYPHERLPFIPRVLDVPDATFDHTGLV